MPRSCQARGEEKVGVSSLDFVCVIQRIIQDRRSYPRNTTNYHQGWLSWCITRTIPASSCADKQLRHSNVAPLQYRRWTFLSPMARSSQHRRKMLSRASGIFSLARKLGVYVGTGGAWS